MELTEPGAREKRRPRAEIRQLVAEFASSGMTESEFCRSRGLSRTTLYRHLRRQRVHGHSVSANTQLVAVELAAGQRSVANHHGGGLTVLLASGRKIEVAAGFDAFTLERLVSVLEHF
jgi:AcrR family transcriptional regulator